MKNCNLNTIKYMKKKFNSQIGFSDHTQAEAAYLRAIALGSNIIEKHFMINEKEKTLDSNFSFGPKRMEELISEFSRGMEISWEYKKRYF